MARFLIGYDLDRPGTDYDGLIGDIESHFTTLWHGLDSTWVVKTKSNVGRIRDLLTSHIDSNDKLIVVKLTGAAACAGLLEKDATWLSTDL